MFRVFWGHTTAIGGAYYRCMAHAFEAKKQGIAESLYMDYDPKRMGNTPNMWERVLLAQEDKQEAIVQQTNAMVRNSDITVYQFFITPIGLALLRMQKDQYKKPMVMELDDYPFDIPALNLASTEFTKGSEKVKIIQQQLKLSDAVITTNDWLANEFRKYNQNVHVVQNSIDFNIWDNLRKKDRPNKRIRLGHIGASAHLEDKHMLKPVVEALIEKYGHDIEFVFVGESQCPSWMIPYQSQGYLKLVPHWVNIDEYPQYLADFNFDIGLAPLRDYTFSRGKSNLRWLEYSALQIPTVASRVGHFRQTIKDGEDGYLCTEADEWIEKLSALIDSEILRRGIGLAGYERVKKDFNLAKVTPQYIDLLKKIKEEHNDNV